MGSVARRAWGALSGLLLGIALLPLGSARAADDPMSVVGCYFVAGQGGLLILAKGEGCEVRAQATWPQTVYEWAGWMEEDGELTLAYDLSWEVRRQLGAASDPTPPDFRFARSSTVAGDWDLVAYRPPLLAPIRRSDRLHSELPPLRVVDPPIPGFLHRVPESPWRAYFGERGAAADFDMDASNGDCGRLRELARAILESAPNDAAAQAVWLDAMVHCNDADAIETAIIRWGQGIVRHSNPHYGFFLSHAGREAAGWRADREGRNGRSAMDLLYGLEATLDERIALAPDLLRFDDGEPDSGGVFRLGIPNFMSYQTTTKVLHIEAEFRMMRGQREEALELALANYRCGQLMEGRSDVIGILIGIAMRQIAAGTLELWLLNACESPSEIERFREGTESLGDLVRHRDAADFQLRASGGAIIDGEANFLEALVRHRLANQRLDLLRSAAAAKKYQLAAKTWPGTAQATNAMFANDPPKDLFSGGWLLGGPRDGGFVVYSVGPDKVDDRAAFSYDPTNGTLSGGDLFIEISAERRYPFSREPFRPKTHDDVARAFPNGLPPDPFAQTRMRPLTVHPDDPTVIFSFGPDFDEAAFTASGGKYPPPQPQYDPTNGIVSAGNLYYRLEANAP